MIIDGHLHLDEELSADEVIRVMDRAGVEQTVLFAGFWQGVHFVPDLLPAISRTLLSSSLLQGLGLKIYNGFHKRDVLVHGARREIAAKLPTGRWAVIPMHPDNEPVARARDKYPERFIPFVFLNGIDEQRLMPEFEKWVDREGFQGVKIHTWSHPFDITGGFLEVAKAAEARGIPLLMHMGGTAPSSNVQGLIEACPDLKIILAHSGIPFFKRSQEQAVSIENVFLDLSGPYLASAPFLKKVIDKVGAKNLIFGSDGLWGLIGKDGSYSYEPCLSRLRGLDLAEQDMQQIMGGTISRALGISS